MTVYDRFSLSIIHSTLLTLTSLYLTLVSNNPSYLLIPLFYYSPISYPLAIVKLL